MLCSHWMVLVHCDRTTQEEKGAEGQVGGGAGGRRNRGEEELGEGGAGRKRSWRKEE